MDGMTPHTSNRETFCLRFSFLRKRLISKLWSMTPRMMTIATHIFPRNCGSQTERLVTDDIPSTYSGGGDILTGWDCVFKSCHGSSSLRVEYSEARGRQLPYLSSFFFLCFPPPSCYDRHLLYDCPLYCPPSSLFHCQSAPPVAVFAAACDAILAHFLCNGSRGRSLWAKHLV